MKIEFYLADFIETLVSGKLVAVGLFTDRVILLNVPFDVPDASKDAPYAFNLSAALCPLVEPGDHSLSVAVEYPGGDRGPTAPPQSFTTLPGRRINIVVPMNPLLVPMAGEFALIATVDGKETRLPFELRVQRLPRPEGAPTSGVT